MANKQEIYETILDEVSNLISLTANNEPAINPLLDNTMVLYEYYKANDEAIQKSEQILFNCVERLKNENSKKAQP